MAKRCVDDGIAGGRTVTLEIKIPNGEKCRRCKAKYAINEHFGNYMCLLYGKKLSWTSYQTSERQYPLGPKVTKYACEKCKECLNGSREFTIGTVNQQAEERKHGHWIELNPHDEQNNFIQCSVCGSKFGLYSQGNYCQECGTKMD